MGIMRYQLFSTDFDWNLLVEFSASRFNFPHTLVLLVFDILPIVPFLSVHGAGSWLCQLLDVFLLSMRHVILSNQPVEPAYNQSLVILSRVNSYVDILKGLLIQTQRS